MRDEKIASALRAETEKRRKAPHRPATSVQGHVRMCLPEIIEAREVMTWDEIAGVMTKAGLRWANGKPLTGKQLRNIASRLRQAEQARGARSGSFHRTGRETGGPANAPSAPARKDGTDRGERSGQPSVISGILEEIKAAQKERQ